MQETQIEKTMGDEYASHSRRGIRWFFSFLATSFVVIAIGIGFVRWSLREGKFTVKTVQIKGVNYADPSELLEQSGLRKGRSIFGGFSEVQERLRRHPMVLSARVEPDYPDAVLITIDERTPIAFIGNKNLKSLDEEGKLLPLDALKHDLDLPILLPPTGMDRESQIDFSDLLPLLRVLKSIRDFDNELMDYISEVGFYDGTDVFITELNSGAVILIRVQLKDEALLRLSVVLKELVNETDGEKVFDLRFRGQIIVRAKSNEKLGQAIESAAAVKSS